MTSPRDTGRLEPGLHDVPEVRLGLAAAVAFVALPMARLLPAHDALVGYAAGLVVAAATLPVLQGQLLAMTAWGLVTGFAVHSGGQLTFSPADLSRLAVLVGVALTVGLVRAARVSRWREPAVVDVPGVVEEATVAFDPGEREPRAGHRVGLGLDTG